jgi:hypothetical protein
MNSVKPCDARLLEARRRGEFRRALARSSCSACSVMKSSNRVIKVSKQDEIAELEQMDQDSHLGGASSLLL